MCGLVGVCRLEPYAAGYKERQVFHNLLVAGSVRGTDGTGVMIISDDGKSRALKIGSHPYHLMADKTYGNFFDPPYPSGGYNPNLPKDKILIGHNRYKTTGNKTTAHAHPHSVGSIILVHNGTLLSYSNLPRYKSFDVDTQALANGIDELGIDECISRTHGAYAIIYYNKKDKTLNVLRNSQRPLHLAIEPNMGRVYFASEKKMLEWVLDRADLMNTPAVEEVPVNMLHTWTLTSHIPTIREVRGPKIAEYNRGPTSWIEDAEAGIVEVFQTRKNRQHQPIPTDKVKQVKKTLSEMRKAGMPISILQEHQGLKKEDTVVFRVTDYADENPAEQTFLVMGETPRLPKTSIRFRLKGEKALDALFDKPDVKATIRNMLAYPDGNEQGDNFVIWVSDAEIYIPTPIRPKEVKTEEPKVDTYGRTLLPIPSFIPSSETTTKENS